MKHIFLNSVITPKTVNEIKFLSLYYDKISVINDAIYTIDINHQTKEPSVRKIPFLPEDFETDYRYLLDDGVLEIVNRDENAEDENFDSVYAKSISELVNKKWDYLFPKKDNNIILSNEVKDIVLYTFRKEKKVPLELLWWFYSFKLKRSLKLLIEGHKCLNSSSNLEYLFNEYVSINTKSKYFESAKLVKQAISMSLPSVDMLNFEDILNLKYKLKDELEEFSNVINSIEVRYKRNSINEIPNFEYNHIFQLEIEKPYKDLQKKIQSLNRKTFLSFINKAKEINTYVPMIGSFIASVPLKYSLMLSLGIISLETYLEYKNNKEELNNNGLNYLLKLNTLQ